jgi:hypothetical protein
MKWQARIGTCFGGFDIFAGHYSSETSAIRLVAEAKSAGATSEDFEKELIWYIYKSVKDVSVRDDRFRDVADQLPSLWR